jgi:DinB family protein
MQETAQQYIQRILGHVEGEDAIKVQKATAAKLKRAIHGLTPKQLKWKPEPGKWSIAEILAHLADAEIVASWRMRVIIGASGTTIQPFDQDVWASVFQYGQRDAKQSVEVFRVLRENNLAMLKALPKETWENYGMHLERGKESIAHLTRMFAGHDTNHLRQIEGIAAQLKSSQLKKAKPKNSRPKNSQLKKKKRK